MGKPVELDPNGLRRAADEFDDVAARTEKLLNDLKGSSESKGEAWGDDHYGEKFAEGDKGYKKNRDNSLDSLSKIIEVFHENAKNLRDSAAMYEENERQQSGG